MTIAPYTCIADDSEDEDEFDELAAKSLDRVMNRLPAETTVVNYKPTPPPQKKPGMRGGVGASKALLSKAVAVTG